MAAKQFGFITTVYAHGLSVTTHHAPIGLSGAVDWPWPSAPAAEIEFALQAVIRANLMLGAMAKDG